MATEIFLRKILKWNKQELILDYMFLACQDTHFILCVFTFFEGEAWVGHGFEPLGQQLCPRPFEGLGGL